MLTAHRLRRTWTRDVDRYIALTEFAKRKFIEAGLPEELIAVKPNFTDGNSPEGIRDERSFLFVGRLSPEKGISTLIAAAQGVPDHVAIKVVGDGPLLTDVQQAAGTCASLVVLGRQDRDSVREKMGAASALIFPSTWYEGFPMTMVEAFASALPVIASRLGSMAELIEDGKTGLLFEPGNADELAAKIRWAAEHPEEMRRMGEASRREYEQKYTPERNYQMLMDIYQQAIEHRRSRSPRRSG
jgi:glycosyltransferase involved in cell wall biosynthesis